MSTADMTRRMGADDQAATDLNRADRAQDQHPGYGIWGPLDQAAFEALPAATVSDDPWSNGLVSLSKRPF